MRTEERLDEFYLALCELHKKNVPDWRVGQLFNNLQNYYGSDLFYVEEDKMLEIAKQYLGEV